jgi:KUP system potassium uptake protein
VDRSPSLQLTEVAACVTQVHAALGSGFYRLRIYFGFMEEPNVPKVLASIADPGIAIDPQTTTFFLGRETIIATRRVAGMALWRERLFSFISLNATTATAYFCIPPDRVVELGEQIEL